MSKQHPPTLTALFVFVSFILLSVHKPILLTAQDPPDTSPITDQITPVVDELTFAPPTETATATETASATLTATASTTETPSATASETPTLGPTEPATATSSATPLDTPTLGPTEPASFTPVWTETPFPTLTLPPTLTETPTTTLTPSFPPEGEVLQPLLTDTFDTGALYFWTLGAGWNLIASEGGQALANPAGDEPVTFVHNTLTDLAVQVRVRFEAGMFRLSLRQSDAGAYTALLSAKGQVALYRGTTVLGAALVAPNQPGQWRTLRLSAIGDIVRVQVDGVEVMAVQDAAPLPQGTFSFAGVGAGGGVVVDDMIIEGNFPSARMQTSGTYWQTNWSAMTTFSHAASMAWVNAPLPLTQQNGAVALVVEVTRTGSCPEFKPMSGTTVGANPSVFTVDTSANLSGLVCFGDTTACQAFSYSGPNRPVSFTIAPVLAGPSYATFQFGWDCRPSGGTADVRYSYIVDSSVVTPTPTPSPTPTPIPLLLYTCTGTVLATTNTVMVRTEPNQGATIITPIPNGQSVMVVGINGDWYRARYNLPSNSEGWIGSSVVDLPNCSDGMLPILDSSGNPPSTPPFDAVLPAAPQEWDPDDVDGTALICQNDEATRANCSRIVYSVYYRDFQTLYGSPPKLSDFLATIFTNEFARAGVTSQLAQNTLANSFWGSIKYISPDCRNDDAVCRAALGNVENLIAYLTGVESWYNKANYGKPHPQNIKSADGTDFLIDDENRKYRSVGFYILGSKGFDCGGGNPCRWGNWGYGSKEDGTQTLNYTLVNDNNSSVVQFCQTVRDFKDGGDIDTAIHPPDDWLEYRFAITTISVGTTSVYRYEDGKPPWLENSLTTTNASGVVVYQRLYLANLATNCPQ